MLRTSSRVVRSPSPINERPISVIRFFALAIVATVGVNAHAGVIVNGDFSDPTDLAGFTVTGQTVTETDGFARFEIGDGVLRTLEQTFVIPLGATALSFDYAFSTTATAALHPSSPDSFAVSLETTIDGELLDIFVVDYGGPIPDPSDGDEIMNMVEAIDVQSVSRPFDGFVGFTGGTTYTGRVTVFFPTQVLGEEATLYFDLGNFDGNAFDSIAAVDNITIIPEPTSFAIWALLVLAPCSTHRRRRG